MNLKDKRILITGGSSGIGFALAHALLAKGARVVVTGRRKQTLDDAVTELRNTGGTVSGVAADVGTANGRATTLNQAFKELGGLDVLINNAGGVRAGRLEITSEAEIETMVNVDLLAPILLTREALPTLRDSGEALIVNIASGIALVGTPFYTTYAAVKAGVAHFGEALRRELIGEGIHVLTAYPGGTDTPMMKSNLAGADLGFSREPASDVADAIVAGIEADALEVIRGGEARAKMIAMNREKPEAVDARFLNLKPALEAAVMNHLSL